MNHISGLLKADIKDEKVDIGERLANIDESIRNKTSVHIIALFEECGKDKVFGRSIVEKITGLKSSRASEIINLMLANEIIEPVKGYGKGKCRFK